MSSSWGTGKDGCRQVRIGQVICTPQSSGDVPTLNTGTPNVWKVSQTCTGGTRWVMIRDWAECSFSRTPVPDCALSGSVCRDNVVAGCDQGYPVISIYGPVSCGSATCTQHGTCAYCEDGTSAPDPACAAGARDTCGGTLTYTCECGRRARPGYDCSDAGAVCVHTGKSGPLGEAASKTFCSVTGQPDPGCGDAGSDWVQTDAGLISCCQGYAVAARSACP